MLSVSVKIHSTRMKTPERRISCVPRERCDPRIERCLPAALSTARHIYSWQRIRTHMCATFTPKTSWVIIDHLPSIAPRYQITIGEWRVRGALTRGLASRGIERWSRVNSHGDRSIENESSSDRCRPITGRVRPVTVSDYCIAE